MSVQELRARALCWNKQVMARKEPRIIAALTQENDIRIDEFCQIYDSEFHDIDVNCSLSECEFNGCRFEKVKFTPIEFDHCALIDCVFDHCDFSNIDLSFTLLNSLIQIYRSTFLMTHN